MSATAGGQAVASVTVGAARLDGGSSTQLTVNLRQAAPAGGVTVQLQSSDATHVTTAAAVNIPAGAVSATVAVSTSPVNAATRVSITALYGNSMAGTTLDIAPHVAAHIATDNIVPPATPPFTVSLQPASLTLAPGKFGTTKVTTKITTGYNHSLSVTASKVPTGVTVKFVPATIPAPGAGTSIATVTVGSTVALGTYSITVKASDGKTTSSATLTLKVSTSDPGAKFTGCWYRQNGNKYQGVLVSVANPGTYPFDADLYNGTTCNPADQADEFGFGQQIKFGTFDFIFWFSDFKNQSNMSALWHVGKDTSACVNYEVAPDCN